MKRAIDETNRRRTIQEAYNEEHGITPQTIIKPIEATLVTAYEADYFKVPLELEAFEEYSMEFERAAELRDRIKYLRERELTMT
jgi:excinuclease ABC subunit B